MQVALISYTPDPELAVAAAARVSTSPVSIAELRERLTPDKVTGLLNHLLASGHMSPFEHVGFIFAIEGISRVTSHQLVRHRLASFTQQSQRYVNMKSLDYVTPPTISQKPQVAAKYKEAVQAVYDLYRQMIADGIPLEDARYILPNAMETRLIMTMNARELMHACSLRLCLRAQWEIVQLFEKIKEEVRKVSPIIGAQLSPKCYNLGYCDEKESCGLFPTRNPPGAKSAGKSKS